MTNPKEKGTGDEGLAASSAALMTDFKDKGPGKVGPAASSAAL